MRIKEFYRNDLDLQGLWARLYELYGWLPPGPIAQEKETPNRVAP